MDNNRHPILQTKVFLIVLTFLTTSCNMVKPPTPNLTTEPIVSTTELVFYSPTNTSTPGRINSPTPIPTVTPTISPTQPNTSTPEYSPTSIPTFLPNLSQDILTGWLNDNGGCQLPCFWGIVPGETNAEEAMSRLYPLTGIAYFQNFDDQHGYLLIQQTIDDILINLIVDYKELEGQNTIGVIGFFSQSLRKIEEGSYEDVYGAPSFNNLLQLYTLSYILSAYGRPSEVILATYARNGPTVVEPFDLYLFYPELGIFVKYISALEVQGDKVIGCPTQAYINIAFISPENRDNYQDILPSINGWEADLTDQFHFPLDEATSLTIDEFYRIFSDPGNITCIETPAILWPDPYNR